MIGKKRHMDLRGAYTSARTSDNRLEVLPAFLDNIIDSYKTDDHMQPQNRVPHSALNKTVIFSTFYNLFFLPSHPVQVSFPCVPK